MRRPRLALVFLSMLMMAVSLAARAAAADGPLSIDYRGLVSRADLDFDTPPARSEEGLPIGNGRMGSLVWTSPTALKLQINRVDVFGADCTTQSFTRTHTDYASGCAFVDI